MTAITEPAPAKVNLGLTLGPLREDGRHRLVTVMQPVDLCDRVAAVPATIGAAGDECACDGVEGENLALAALRAFREATGWDGAPLRLEIEKKIPIAAGMAGGSADAGAALRIAERLSGVEDEELVDAVAAGLGSDVPAQLWPTRYLATGAGDVLHALPEPAPFGVLVVPSVHRLATPDVFREADRLGLPRSGAEVEAREAELVGALAAGAAFPPEELMANDLEPAAVSLLPELEWTLDEVRGAGALRAFVCGSGPTVVGLFDGIGSAVAAATALAGREPRPVAVEPWYPSALGASRR
jgi:4-diphosphocytidyl-2-C-methyl-D-erythritol kinase